MWPVIMAAMRTYAPYVVFPFAAAIGFIGYNIEGTISDRYTPWRGSVIERREQRLLEEEKEANASGGLKNPDFVPKSIFEKNTSPSLQKP